MKSVTLKKLQGLDLAKLSYDELCEYNTALSQDRLQVDGEERRALVETALQLNRLISAHLAAQTALAAVDPRRQRVELEGTYGRLEASAAWQKMVERLARKILEEGK